MMNLRVVIELYVEEDSPIVPLDGSTIEAQEFVRDALETIDGVEVMKIDVKRR